MDQNINFTEKVLNFFYLDQLKNLKLSGIQKAKADQVKSNFWK